MPNTLQGKRIAFLVAPEGVEQVELTSPWEAVEESGGTPRLVSTAPGLVQAFNHLDKGDTFEVDDTVDSVDAGVFDALVLPGGVANPDYLRTQPAAVAFARSFFDAGKPVAVICHGPWQITATGLPLSTNAFTNATASPSVRSWSGLATPPGSTSPT